MNNQESINNTPTDTTMNTPRPWIDPTFERTALQEALSGGSGNIDGLYSNS